MATPPAKTKTTRKAPSIGGVRQLIEAAGDDIDLATAVMLGAITGARRGELCGLKWPDVEWNAASLHVQRQWIPVTGGDKTGPLKDGGPRLVAIGAAGLATLRAYWNAQAARAAALGIKMPADGMRAPGPVSEHDPGGAWLLSYDCGRNPMRTKALTAAFKALGERAGIPSTFHELRHFHGTQLIRGDTDVVTSSSRLGNTPEMLLEVYAHAVTDGDRAAAEMIEIAVLGVLEPVGS